MNEKDLIAGGGILFKNFTVEKFSKIVIPWRETAWEHYQTLQHSKKSGVAVRRIHREAEEIARKILHLGSVGHVSISPLQSIYDLEQLAQNGAKSAGSI